MAKFCTNCGQEIPEGNRACTNCGTLVDGGSPVTTTVNVNNVQNPTNGFAIAGFIISLVLFGVGCGLISIGVLHFDVMMPNETMLKSDSLEMNMNDKFFITNRSDIEYIVDNRDNVKITYQINKLCHANHSHYDGDQAGIYLYTYCNEPTKLVREFIKGVNQKKIIPIDDMVSDIKVYASEDNINKIKNNKEEYYNSQKSIEERYQSYEDDIHDLTSKIYTYEEKINELERKLDEYEKRD